MNYNPTEWYVVDDEHVIHVSSLPAVDKPHPTLTVATVTDGYQLQEHVDAVLKSWACLPERLNAKCLLISPEKPSSHISDEILGWKQLPRKFTSVSDYCEFLLRELGDYIDTDFCLFVHADGYATNPKAWTDEFLRYDYVGAPFCLPALAPWFIPNLRRRVGNGGFSVRSSRWLKLGKTAKAYRGQPEDVFACRTHVKHWLRAGCRIAPLDLAIRFSVDSFVPEFPDWLPEDSFGFHGLLPDGRKRFAQAPQPWRLLRDHTLTFLKNQWHGYQWTARGVRHEHQ